MRERARRASTGEPWEAAQHYDALYDVDLKPSLGQVDGLDDDNSFLIVPGTQPYEAPRFLFACHEHAEYIASWHPALALLVADVLDHEAQSAQPDERIRSIAWAYLGGVGIHEHGSALSADAYQPAADDCPYTLVDLPCGCQDVHYACGYIDREHDHVQCFSGGVPPV
jgi:hypothetical protein